MAMAPKGIGENTVHHVVCVRVHIYEMYFVANCISMKPLFEETN